MPFSRHPLKQIPAYATIALGSCPGSDAEALIRSRMRDMGGIKRMSERCTTDTTSFTPLVGSNKILSPARMTLSYMIEYEAGLITLRFRKPLTSLTIRTYSEQSHGTTER